MSNEKRLVNAEAIARKLKNAHCAECNIVRKIQCSACWVEDVLELLEGDAVDAVEVVRCMQCRDCELWYPEKQPGCHDTCKERQKWKLELDRVNAARKEYDRTHYNKYPR